MTENISVFTPGAMLLLNHMEELHAQQHPEGKKSFFLETSIHHLLLVFGMEQDFKQSEKKLLIQEQSFHIFVTHAHIK